MTDKNQQEAAFLKELEESTKKAIEAGLSHERTKALMTLFSDSIKNLKLVDGAKFEQALRSVPTLEDLKLNRGSIEPVQQGTRSSPNSSELLDALKDTPVGNLDKLFKPKN